MKVEVATVVCACKLKFNCYKIGLQSLEPDVDMIVSYYDLPSVSFRDAVFPLILEGRKGYRVKRSCVCSFLCFLKSKLVQFACSKFLILLRYRLTCS